MDIEEISESNLGGSSSSHEALESEEKNMGTQRILVSDHINAYQYSAEEADSFVIDMDSFSSGINKDSNNANSRITLQRSLSRKGSQRGGDRKVNGNVTLHDRDTAPTTCSPKAALAGSCTAEKSAVVAVGSTHHSTNTQVRHQITITASSMCTTTTPTTESKCITRRNSFKRSSSWLLDPKRVLLFFATLSSMGTMLLIYFTLTLSKQMQMNMG
uniref:Transmembrane protein n=1 Tax=Glycine max TaxID=3847 RepID=C6T3L9_SOYBN|nr:unknown [Glycine max]